MSSRFKNIFDTAKETEITTPKKSNEKIKREVKEEKVLPTALPTPPLRKKGNGKSSNPDYIQALAYLKKDTLRQVKEKLFYNPSQDFSDLVENLLSEWLKKQK